VVVVVVVMVLLFIMVYSEHLQLEFARVVANGGEGLVLRNPL